MIIDAHTHLNRYSDESLPALPGVLEDLRLNMRRCRIDMAMVLSSYKANPGRPSTRQVVDALRGSRDLFVVAGLSHAAFGPGTVEELRVFLERGEIRGLKLYCGYEPYYPTDPKIAPALDLAEEFDVPVLIHAGDTYAPSGRLKYSHPLNVDDLAVDRPRLKIVICHLGSPWFRDCMEIVYKNANVYTDISGLVLGDFNDRFERFMCDQLQEMLAYGVEPAKVLYGSDWPIASMDAYLNFMERLRMPLADRSKIMFENAARLFKLDVSGAQMGPSSRPGWLR